MEKVGGWVGGWKGLQNQVAEDGQGQGGEHLEKVGGWVGGKEEEEEETCLFVRRDSSPDLPPHPPTHPPTQSLTWSGIRRLRRREAESLRTIQLYMQ